MAAEVNWEELLQRKYPLYRIEVKAFLDNVHISNSNDVSMQKIYAVIQNDQQVDADLKMLYHEAIHGSNKDVKARIHSHITNFRRGLR